MTGHLRRTGGFTLIEVMIAVSVVGILAAIALPNYHTHTVRARVTECLTLATVPRLAVGESLASNQPRQVHFEPTEYCEDIAVANDGTILLTTRNTGAGTQPVLQLVPQFPGGSISWRCEYVAGRAAHVPSSCRSQGTAPDPSAFHSSAFDGSGPASPPAAGTGTGGQSGSGGSGGSGASNGHDYGGGPGGSGSGPNVPGGSSGTGGSGNSGDTGGAAPGAGSGTPPADTSGTGGSGDAGSGPGNSGNTGGGPGNSGNAPGNSGNAGGGSGSGNSGNAPGNSGGGGAGGGAGNSGGGGQGGGAGLGGSGDADDDEDELEDCPHRLPNGRPNPGLCR